MGGGTALPQSLAEGWRTLAQHQLRNSSIGTSSDRRVPIPTPFAGTAEWPRHLCFFIPATQPHHVLRTASVTARGKPLRLLINLFHTLILNSLHCLNRSHKAGVSSKQYHTCFFFSFCSRTFCRIFFCFLLRGFFRCGTTQATFFFLTFFAGRIRALLASIPFSVAASESMRWITRWCQAGYSQRPALQPYRKPYQIYPL